MDAMNSVSITGGGYTAEISLLGGQLLSLTHHEDELIVPAAKTEGAFAGAVLAPWPNRTKGGSYTYAGVEHMLPVNEEATGAALHGLLIDLPLRVISQKESEVQLQGWLESSEGYPFGLDIALTYRVSADLGLAATLMARYRPEELEEHDAPVTEAPPTELNDTVADDASVEAGEPEASAAGNDAASASEEPDSTSPSDDESVSAAAEGDATDSAIAEDDATDGQTADDETAQEAAAEGGSADGEAAEEDVAVSEDGDQPSAATVDESEAPDTEAPDAAATDPDGSDIEPAPAPQTAPFGAGFHPYLSAGGASLKECRLRLPAQMMLKTKADGTVTGRKPVSQDFDLTTGPLLAGRTIDHAFTDLPKEGWTAELIHGPSGFVVRMIADSPWVQVYTGERINRAGVAIEPMTCPPNAFNSGEDLIHLVPGKWFRMGYSIEAIRAD